MSDLEKITRRESFGLVLAGLVGALSSSCRERDTYVTDTDNPETPNTNPGPNPQQDFHHFSGTIQDTNNNLISGSTVKLRVRNNTKTYEAVSINGDYRILNIPNGDYVLTIENIPGFFAYEDPVKIISAQQDISRNFFLIRSSPLISTQYGNLLEILKDVTENNDGRTSARPDSIQKVRRFDLSARVKVFLDSSSQLGSSGYSSSVQTALNEWESALGKNPQELFEETALPRDAKIEFSYTGIGENARTEIIETETKNGVSIIKKAKVLVDSSLSLTDVRKVALREIGTILLGAKRGSKDQLHAIFKDPNNLNLILSTGITDDESSVVKEYYGLPIGEDLNPYRI